MNKLLTFVLLSAVAFAFVYGQDDYTSESSENPFTNESSSEPSSSDFPSESGFSDDSSSSSSVLNCVDGEYNNGTACVPCAELLHCATCSSGRDCETCPPGYVLDSQTRYCVLDCSQFGDGCSFCSQTKCITCNKQACCNSMEWYWNNATSVCENPAIHFGKGCLKTDGEICTLCTAESCCGVKKYFDFSDSTCKSCSLYGESCEKCVSGTCTKCGEGETADADGVCKSCVTLFGEGCTNCSAAECTETDETHFVRGSYSTACNQVFGENCAACSTEDGCSSCGDGEVPVNGFCKSCYPCKATACSPTGCTECEDGYYLNDDGACIACSKAFGAGCTACNADGCIGASGDSFVSNGFAFNCRVLCDATNGQDALDKCDTTHTAEPCEEVIHVRRAQKVGVIYIYLDEPYAQVDLECDQLSEGCTNCDTVEGKTVCTECSNGKLLVGGMCHTCAQLHNDDHCLECSDGACTGCEDGWNLNGEGKCIKCDTGKFFDEKTKSCVECGEMYLHCDTCNDGVCSACEGDYYLKDGKCKTCMDMYNPACTSCTSTECTACISDECCDGDEHIINSNGQYDCKACAEAYEDEKCNDCTATECTSCEAGFAKGPSTKCTSCSDLFEGCSLCDEDHCLECADEKALNLGNGCFIQPDTDSSNPSSSNPSSSNPSSSNPQPHSPSSEPVSPISPPSDDSPKDSNVGLIAGIIVAVIVAAIIIAVCAFCVATAGKKHGKVDPIIYEEDPQFISMSVF